MGGFGRFARGLKKNKKSKPKLKVKKEGKFTWWGGAGGMAVGSGRGKCRPEIERKIQHASPPFRWKGAADSQGSAPATGPLVSLLISGS